MKNILLVIVLFFITPSFMPASFINVDNKANIKITSDKLECITTLTHNKRNWTVKHFKQLKIGLNNFYFVPFDGMSVEIIINKY